MKSLLQNTQMKNRNNVWYNKCLCSKSTFNAKTWSFKPMENNWPDKKYWKRKHLLVKIFCVKGYYQPGVSARMERGWITTLKTYLLRWIYTKSVMATICSSGNKRSILRNIHFNGLPEITMIKEMPMIFLQKKLPMQ